MRFNFYRFSVLFITCLFLHVTTSFAQQQNIDPPSATSIALDGLIIRPLSLGATLLGGVIFTITLPFTIFANTQDVWDALVIEPLQFTFNRPFGEYDNWQPKEQL